MGVANMAPKNAKNEDDKAPGCCQTMCCGVTLVILAGLWYLVVIIATQDDLTNGGSHGWSGFWHIPTFFVCAKMKEKKLNAVPLTLGERLRDGLFFSGILYCCLVPGILAIVRNTCGKEDPEAS